LRQESHEWCRTDKSKTADTIAVYEQALGILLEFVRTRKIKEFVYTFKKYKISVVGIRDCFRKNAWTSSDDSLRKRNTVNHEFKVICDKMLTLLDREDIRKVVVNSDLSAEEAIGLFQQGSKD